MNANPGNDIVVIFFHDLRSVGGGQTIATALIR